MYCKLSGMVTEASWSSWSADDLRPFVEQVVQWFGPNRLLFGSDWPVLNLASSYQRWIDTVRAAIAQLSTTERERIFAGTAIEAYGLART